MPTMTEMQEMVEDKVLFLMIQFEERVGNDACKYELNAPDEIRFDKTGATAGISYFNYHKGSGHLNFNPVLMTENWDHFIDSTVVHEVAHYCVSIYCGYLTSRSGRKQSHGRSWKNMMRFFGITDVQRCHTYDTSTVKRVRKVKRFSYECSCGHDHKLSTRMHNQIVRGRRRICSKCNSTVEFTGIVNMVGG